MGGDLGGTSLERLDNPVWESLIGRHAHLAEGVGLARRYRPDVNVFVAVDEPTPDALAAVTAQVPAGQPAFFMRRRAVPTPEGFAVAPNRPAVQLVSATAPGRAPDSDDVVVLQDADAPEMLALARLTEPGPFAINTRLMGRFIGVRERGRLIAMAGERLRPEGFTEVSGVCTHPDARGRGLARRLTSLVTLDVIRRGETPFLHAWADNRGAIELYETLGFAVRTEMFVAVMTRDGAESG